LIEKQQTEFKDLCEKIKEILGNEVENVIISNRLSNSPCVLVTNEWGMSANMQRIMKAQALRNNQDMSYMMGRKSMEINPNNKIMINLNEQVKEKESMNIKLVRDLVWLMYEVALINSGFTLDNPRDFSNRIHSLIAIGLSIDDTETDANTDTGTDNNEVGTEETTTDSVDESTMEHVD
jgi:molecular chaperone HtpG